MLVPSFSIYDGIFGFDCTEFYCMYTSILLLNNGRMFGCLAKGTKQADGGKMERLYGGEKEK